MDKKSLNNVTTLLNKSLRTLSASDVEDSKLRAIYSEYWVANELSKRGYAVQLHDERKNKNADIYLPEEDIKIEVKSGRYNSNALAVASFGTGNQILKNKFDYCVFTAFSQNGNSQIDDAFIFTRDELVPIAKSKREVAMHPDTNPCLLFVWKKPSDYKNNMLKKEMVNIELDLNENRRKYNNRWEKIK